MVAWNRYKQFAKGPEPDVVTIRAMIETAFFLSLRKEEGHPLAVRLTYLDADSISDREKRGQTVAAVTFAAPIGFTVEQLVKLSPSIDANTSTFVVASTEGGLQIVGIFQFGPNLAPLARTGRNIAPMGFGVLTRGAGRLAITVGPFLIARVEDGQVRLPVAGSLGDSLDLGRPFFDAALTHSFHSCDKEEYAELYLCCFEELLHDMAAHGHGGTILWVPATKMEAALARVNVRRRIGRVSHSGVDHVSRYLSSSAETRDQMLSRLRQYVAMLARFACVDGALLIDDFLRPIGYSVKIEAPHWDGPILAMSDDEERAIDLATYGMRHNSAAAFVAAVPDSVALVLSQDGPARGMRLAGDTLQWWPNCTAAVFV